MAASAANAESEQEGEVPSVAEITKEEEEVEAGTEEAKEDGKDDCNGRVEDAPKEESPSALSPASEVSEESPPAPDKSSMDNDAWIRYLDSTDPTHRLRSLCKRGDLEALREFLSSEEGRRADVNHRCKEGWTCLHEIITHECQFTEVTA